MMLFNSNNFLLALVFISISVPLASSLLAMPRSSRYGVITNIDDSDDMRGFSASKRYDRNCFFSPVQCMLSFNEDNRLPLVVTRKGKRAVPMYIFRK